MVKISEFCGNCRKKEQSGLLSLLSKSITSNKRNVPDKIYFINIKSTSQHLFIKLEFQDAPQKRLEEIKTATPFDVSIIKIISVGQGARYIERRIHDHLNKFHVKGEWFNLKICMTDLSDYKVKKSHTIFGRLFNRWEIWERRHVIEWPKDEENEPSVMYKNFHWFTGSITECESWLKLYNRGHVKSKATLKFTEFIETLAD